MKAQLLGILALHLCIGATSADDSPQRLIQLRESWESAKERALRPINLKYKQELEQLLADLTKAGRLDEALSVKSELESLEPQKVSELTEKPIRFEQWVKNRRIKHGGSGAIYVIKGDVLQMAENVTPKITSVDDEKREVHYIFRSGSKGVLRFDESLQQGIIAENGSERPFLVVNE